MADLSLALIKCVIFVYDVLTLPIYALVQQPWLKWHRMRAPRGRTEIAGDPTSAWINCNPSAPCDYSSCATYAEMVATFTTKYSDYKCLGHRKALSVDTIQTPEGKIIKRKLLDDKYTWLTYDQVSKRVRTLQHGLYANGVRPGDRVVILMETRLEWQLYAQAIMGMGAILGTLYATLGKEGIAHSINELEARHLVTSGDLLNLVVSLDTKLLTNVYVVDLEKKDSSSANNNNNNTPRKNGQNALKVISSDQLEKVGQQSRANQTKLDRIKPKPDDVALIMYTSGSSGLPKGVIVTQEQFVHAFTCMSAQFGELKMAAGVDSILSYLPLAHIFQFMLELMGLCMGLGIGYGSPLTFVDKSPGLVKGCPGDATVLKPIGMATVPLIMDKFKAAILSQIRGMSPFMQALFHYMVDYKDFWARMGFDTPLVDRVLFKKVQGLLGGNMKHMVIGAAPLSTETQRFARTVLGLNLLQGYGASENLAVGTVMATGDLSLGECGAPMPGVKIKLVPWKEGGYDPRDKPRARGEIWIGARHVARAYFKRAAETEDTFKSEPKMAPGFTWFKSGDIGEMTPDGSLLIIDRKKDLVKLQNGEYISLGKVESVLKGCPFVDNICIHADSACNHVVALILPNRKHVMDTAASLGGDLVGASWSQLCADPRMVGEALKSIQETARAANLGRLEIPAKVKLCSSDWTPSTGLVTATMKIRRKYLTEHYKRDLAALYRNL